MLIDVNIHRHKSQLNCQIYWIVDHTIIQVHMNSHIHQNKFFFKIIELETQKQGFKVHLSMHTNQNQHYF